MQPKKKVNQVTLDYRRFVYRSIALILLVTFLVSNSSDYLYAALSGGVQPNQNGVSSADPRSLADSLSLPEEYGTIVEKFLPADGEKKLVIYVQDAHANFDSEMSVRKIIELFQKNYGLKLVLLEGGEGKLDNLYFKSFADRDVKEKILNDYLKKGELQGAEAAAILEEEAGTQYYGIETQALYDENKKEFLAALAKENEIKEELSKLEKRLAEEAKTSLSEPVKEFLKQNTAFHDQKINLIQYINSLNVSIDRYPELQKLVELQSKEKFLSGPDLDEAMNQLIRDFKLQIVPTLSKPKQIEIGSVIQSYQTGTIHSGVLINQIERLTAGTEFKISAVLKPSQAYGKLITSIRGTKVFDELEALEKEIREALPKTPEERALLAEFQKLELLKQLSKFELTHQEWKEVEALETSAFEHHIRFYQLALERDRALFSNMMKRMASDEARITLLSTGGFHREGITAEMREKKIPFIVIAPNIHEIGDKTNYLNVMQGRSSYMRYFKGSVWEALAHDYAAKLSDTLNERDRIPSLKRWRDRIIQNAIAEGRITEANSYTKYVDLIAKSLSGGSAVNSETLRSKIEKALDEFISNYLSRSKSGPPSVSQSNLQIGIALIPNVKHEFGARVTESGFKSQVSSTGNRSELRASSKVDVPLYQKVMPKRRLRFLESIRKIVNRDNKEVVTWYQNSGGDPVNALLATNPSVLIMTDQLAFQPDKVTREFTDVDLRAALEMDKISETGLKSILADHGSLYAPVSALLKSLGVYPKEMTRLSPDSDDWKITFHWTHPSDPEFSMRPRSIYFLGSRKVEDKKPLPTEVNDLLERNEGVDVFMEKAPNYYKEIFEKDLSRPDPALSVIREVNDIKERLVKAGGFLIGDDEQGFALFYSRSLPSSNRYLSQRNGEFAFLKYWSWDFWKIFFWSFFEKWGNGPLEILQRVSGLSDFQSVKTKSGISSAEEDARIRKLEDRLQPMGLFEWKTLPPGYAGGEEVKLKSYFEREQALDEIEKGIQSDDPFFHSDKMIGLLVRELEKFSWNKGLKPLSNEQGFYAKSLVRILAQLDDPRLIPVLLPFYRKDMNQDFLEGVSPYFETEHIRKMGREAMGGMALLLKYLILSHEYHPSMDLIKHFLLDFELSEMGVSLHNQSSEPIRFAHGDGRLVIATRRQRSGNIFGYDFSTGVLVLRKVGNRIYIESPSTPISGSARADISLANTNIAGFSSQYLYKGKIYSHDNAPYYEIDPANPKPILISFGRSPDNDLQFIMNANDDVSRTHGKIEIKPDGSIVIHDQSRNGTQVFFDVLDSFSSRTLARSELRVNGNDKIQDGINLIWAPGSPLAYLRPIINTFRGVPGVGHVVARIGRENGNSRKELIGELLVAHYFQTQFTGIKIHGFEMHLGRPEVDLILDVQNAKSISGNEFALPDGIYLVEAKEDSLKKLPMVLNTAINHQVMRYQSAIRQQKANGHVQGVIVAGVSMRDIEIPQEKASSVGKLKAIQSSARNGHVPLYKIILPLYDRRGNFEDLQEFPKPLVSDLPNGSGNAMAVVHILLGLEAAIGNAIAQLVPHQTYQPTQTAALADFQRDLRSKGFDSSTIGQISRLLTYANQRRIDRNKKRSIMVMKGIRKPGEHGTSYRLKAIHRVPHTSWLMQMLRSEGKDSKEKRVGAWELPFSTFQSVKGRSDLRSELRTPAKKELAIEKVLNEIWARGSALAFLREPIVRFKSIPGMGNLLYRLSSSKKASRDEVIGELMTATYLEDHVNGAKVIGLGLMVGRQEVDLIVRVTKPILKDHRKLDLEDGIYLVETKDNSLSGIQGLISYTIKRQIARYQREVKKYLRNKVKGILVVGSGMEVSASDQTQLGKLTSVEKIKEDDVDVVTLVFGYEDLIKRGLRAKGQRKPSSRIINQWVNEDIDGLDLLLAPEVRRLADLTEAAIASLGASVSGAKRKLKLPLRVVVETLHSAVDALRSSVPNVGVQSFSSPVSLASLEQVAQDLADAKVDQSSIDHIMQELPQAEQRRRTNERLYKRQEILDIRVKGSTLPHKIFMMYVQNSDSWNVQLMQEDKSQFTQWKSLREWRLRRADIEGTAARSELRSKDQDEPKRPEDFGQPPYKLINIGGKAMHALPNGNEVEVRKIETQVVPFNLLGRFAIGTLTFRLIQLSENQLFEDLTETGIKVGAGQAKFILQVYFNHEWMDLESIDIEDGSPIIFKREHVTKPLDPIHEIDMEVDSDSDRHRIAIQWKSNEIEKVLYLPLNAFTETVSRGPARHEPRPGLDLNTGQYLAGYLQAGHLELEIMGDAVKFSDLGSTDGTLIEIYEAKRHQQHSRDNMPLSLVQDLKSAEPPFLKPNEIGVFTYEKPFYVAALIHQKEKAKARLKVENGSLYVLGGSSNHWRQVSDNEYLAEEEVPVAGQTMMSMPASVVRHAYKVVYSPERNEVYIYNFTASKLRIAIDASSEESRSEMRAESAYQFIGGESNAKLRDQLRQLAGIDRLAVDSAVYNPTRDDFLSFDIVQDIAPKLREAIERIRLNGHLYMRPLRILVAGTGTGIDALALYHQISKIYKYGMKIDAIDINEAAIRNTEFNVKLAGKKQAEAITARFVQEGKELDFAKEPYDLVVFNAPNAVNPTEKEGYEYAKASGSYMDENVFADLMRRLSAKMDKYGTIFVGSLRSVIDRGLMSRDLQWDYVSVGDERAVFSLTKKIRSELRSSVKPPIDLRTVTSREIKAEWIDTPWMRGTRLASFTERVEIDNTYEEDPDVNSTSIFLETAFGNIRVSLNSTQQELLESLTANFFVPDTGRGPALVEFRKQMSEDLLAVSLRWLKAKGFKSVRFDADDGSESFFDRILTKWMKSQSEQFYEWNSPEPKRTLIIDLSKIDFKQTIAEFKSEAKPEPEQRVIRDSVKPEFGTRIIALDNLYTGQQIERAFNSELKPFPLSAVLWVTQHPRDWEGSTFYSTFAWTFVEQLIAGIESQIPNVKFGDGFKLITIEAIKELIKNAVVWGNNYQENKQFGIRWNFNYQTEMLSLEIIDEGLKDFSYDVKGNLAEVDASIPDTIAGRHKGYESILLQLHPTITPVLSEAGARIGTSVKILFNHEMHDAIASTRSELRSIDLFGADESDAGHWEINDEEVPYILHELSNLIHGAMTVIWLIEPYDNAVGDLIADYKSALSQLVALKKSNFIGSKVNPTVKLLNLLDRITSEEQIERLIAEAQKNAEVRSLFTDPLIKSTRLSLRVLRLFTNSWLGKVSEPNRPVHLRELAEAVVHGMRQDSIKNAISITIANDLVINSDELLLFRVLYNLVKNAVQATSEDKRHIDIRALKVEDANRILIEVEDNGSGIVPEAIGKIFAPFFTTKEPGQGTGIGLTMVKDIIEKQLEGAITVESVVDRGTKFSLSFPIKQITNDSRSELRLELTGKILKLSRETLPEAEFVTALISIFNDSGLSVRREDTAFSRFAGHMYVLSQEASLPVNEGDFEVFELFAKSKTYHLFELIRGGQIDQINDFIFYDPVFKKELQEYILNVMNAFGASAKENVRIHLIGPNKKQIDDFLSEMNVALELKGLPMIATGADSHIFEFLNLEGNAGKIARRINQITRAENQEKFAIYFMPNAVARHISDQNLLRHAVRLDRDDLIAEVQAFGIVPLLDPYLNMHETSDLNQATWAAFARDNSLEGYGLSFNGGITVSVATLLEKILGSEKADRARSVSA